MLKEKLHQTFSKELPADTSEENYPRQVQKTSFSYVKPMVFPKAKLIHYSDELMNELGLKLEEKELLSFGVGEYHFDNFKPYAMRYGGHQFGQWAGQLGDGRAINIAELDLADKNWKFQLKGAGPTPYSRRADGFAVLRSSIREYLCSEGMHHLGVPTTRALSLALTGEQVMRDMLYDGHPDYEPGAIVCRVSPSFLRFGNYQIHTATQEFDILKQLVDYTIKNHYSYLGMPSKETYLAFYKEVCDRTMEMILHWQRVGFVHGVMNTDNMSILGLTIDYGPYGWLEDYNPNWTPNTTDGEGRRYAFGNQPKIALWNLVQLANGLYPLINEAEPFEKILENTYDTFFEKYHQMMCSKLGLTKIEIPKDFIDNLTDLLEKEEIDMTLFYRKLSTENILDEKIFKKVLEASTYKANSEIVLNNFKSWYKEYHTLLKSQNNLLVEVQKEMQKINPKYVLRNYMAQLAIEDAEKGSYDLIDELYQLLKKPYEEQPNMEKWFAKRPDWAKHKVGCSMLSCSS